MADDPIELFAELRRGDRGRHLPGQGGGAPRMAVIFKAPEISWRLDEKKLAQDVAIALEQVWRTSLLSGRTPGGAPLPAAAAATIERRRYRAAQAARGGAPASEYRRRESNDYAAEQISRAGGRLDEFGAGLAKPKLNSLTRYDKRTASLATKVGRRIVRHDEATIRKAIDRFNRRFNAPRLGRFDPRNGPGGGQWFGVESGMLANSIAVRAVADNTWALFVATPRGNVGRDGDSALGRVMRRIGAWTRAAMNRPEIQAALRECQKRLWPNRFHRLGGALLRLGGDVEGIRQEAEQIARSETAQGASVGESGGADL